MIIEDDINIRHILNRLLKKNFECEVVEAENGEIGLSLLSSSTPDLILLDLSMPVMDGFQVLERIRANSNIKDIPVIVCTALSNGKIVSKLAELGISDYLLKPIDIDDSVKRIQKIINKEITAAGIEVPAIEEHVIIVDTDTQFKSFFKLLFGNKFVIHEAVSGIDVVENYTKLKPKFVFVSDRLGMLDKKIITQKIKQLDSNNTVFIYLLVDDLSKLSTKVFNYDGIIKKSLEKENFLENNDFVKKYFPEMLVVEG